MPRIKINGAGNVDYDNAASNVHIVLGAIMTSIVITMLTTITILAE